MKHRGFRFASSVLIAATVGAICWVSAGDLNPPPGPIEPTMKTLDQIEPRTVIVPTAEGGTVFAQRQPQLLTCPGTITASGSYYLAADCTGGGAIQHGIVITADNVTLDLNGYALIGAGAPGNGIDVPAAISSLAVRNGTVREWGGDGVDAFNASACQFENLRALDNGADGLLAGEGSTVTNCTAQGNGRLGIFANLGSTVTNCTATLNTDDGISAGEGCTVTDCTARSNGDDGIITSGSTVTNCTVSNNTGDGIQVRNDSRVVGNNCHSNGLDAGDGAGIHATSGDNRIEGNHVTNNDRGIDLDSAGNYVANNTIQGNTDNYDIVAGNKLNILLCEIPESIDWPAMVTLAGSLTGIAEQNGITVNADNVTIDLGGHTLIGVEGSLDGIFVAFVDEVARDNLVVRNGTLRDWGGNGVGALVGEFSVDASQFENLRVLGNGVDGLRSGSGSTVTNCTASSNGGMGIYAGFGSMVTNCTATENGGSGICAFASTFTNCTVRSNTGDGIFANGSSTVTNCTATLNTGDGIVTGFGSTVTNCAAARNTGDGIEIGGDSRVVGNNCWGNGLDAGDGAGIHAPFSNSRIEGNNVTGNDRGIDVDASGNIIIKNTASGNTANYAAIVAGNHVG